MIVLPFLFSQFDSRWCNHLLGNNTDKQYTIYNYGCLLCCVAMLLEYYGVDINPLALNQQLIDGNAFQTQSGIYEWGSLNRLFPGISDTITKTPASLTDAQMSEIKTSIDNGKPVILQIDYNPKVVTPTMHFVVAIAYNPNDENDITIADPLGGKIHSLKDYLGWFHPSARRTIEAYCLIDGQVPKLTNDNTIPVNATVFPSIVHGSEQWDKTITKYVPDRDPKQTQFEDFDKVIGGIKSRATDLSKQLDNQKGDLAEAQQQAKNAQEQLAHVQAQQQQDKVMYLAQIQALKTNGQTLDQVSGLYEGRIKALQDTITGLMQDKHSIAVQNARMQALAAVSFLQKYTPTFISWFGKINGAKK